MLHPEISRKSALLDRLLSLPKNDAIALLEKLRISAAATQSPDYSPSEYKFNQSLLAPTRNDVEFELSIRHVIAYPPLNSAQPEYSELIACERPLSIAYTKRESSRGVFDERLINMDMKNWSRVLISRELAASIISYYIANDYQTMPLFHLELFLQSFAANDKQFCSSIFVNSLFSWACVGHIALLHTVLPLRQF